VADEQNDAVDIELKHAETSDANADATDIEMEAGTVGEGGGDPEILRLQQELSAVKDQALRAHAEAQNALRRAERDVEKAHKFGQEKLIGDLLVVVDNLERSLNASEGQEVSLESIKEGVELTLKSLMDTLKRHNVEQVDPEGQPFDPALHQAMTMVPSPDAEPNSVINVFQKGYTLHGRLVRPAMVVVSKAPDNK